jgi:hypothetical protein
MGKALHEDVGLYESLFDSGLKKMEMELFNGEYFRQIVDWQELSAQYPQAYEWRVFFSDWVTPDTLALAASEGPPYQYGNGCLSDGAIGAWLAWACGLEDIIDSKKVRSHLQSVYRYNFRRNLSTNINCNRLSFACGNEGGLLLCTWPKGGAPTLPMMYSGEVWTGIEYQVATHMIALGMVDEGLELVCTARARYDGQTRNPFDEIEAGHWYARAMASYSLLQAISGARFDAVDRILYLRPAIKGDFRCFLSTATGYGTVGIQNGAPFLHVVSGEIPYREIRYTPA